MESEKWILKYIDRITGLMGVAVAGSIGLMVSLVFWLTGSFAPGPAKISSISRENVPPKDTIWHAPDVSTIRDSNKRRQVEYGRELIAHTSAFLGPNGSVAHISNGLNCQNCHLDAGTKPFGNNYAMVAATYPKFRARSGSIETVEKRVNDCFERSLNGKALDTVSAEMMAIVSYIEFVGSNVNATTTPLGAGMKKTRCLIVLPILNKGNNFTLHNAWRAMQKMEKE